MNKEPAIILDPGSGSIKFGISYFDASCEQKIYQNMSIPSIYGESRYPSSLFRKTPIEQRSYRRDYVIGKHALMLYDILDITFPVQRGIVTNWDIVLKILHDGLELFQKTIEIPNSILVSEPWFQPRKKREEMIEYIFEKYDYDNFFSVPQVVLTLFNYNQKTGYVIESGAKQTQFAHIFNGHKIQNECLNYNKGGFDVSVLLPDNAQIDKNNFELNTVEEKLFKKAKLNPYQHFYEIDNLKRKEIENFKVDEYYDKVFFSDENENLFSQIDEIIGKENDHSKSQNSELYFGGGNFACDYFKNKIDEKYKKRFRIHTLAADEFEWCVWKGGNKFVNTEAMKDFWIPINDYYEIGANVVNFSGL